MDVRILKQHEILPALHLIWEVFAEDVAPAYTPEGVAHFQEFIKYDNISDMYRRERLPSSEPLKERNYVAPWR